MIFGYVTNISVVIQGDGLGNATEAGMAISVFTFGTLLAGFVFGRIKHMLPTMYLPIAIGMTALGMAICYFSPSLIMIFIGSIIGGAGMGIGLPGLFSRVSDLTPAVIMSAGVGLVVASQGVGGIMGPFVFQIFQTLFNQDIGRFPLAISAIGLIVLAIIWTIFGRKIPKQDLDVSLNQ